MSTTIRTKTLLILMAVLASAAPLAAGHSYQGHNPPPCPDDGQVHEHREQDGTLFCRSSPCTNDVRGIEIVDPLSGRPTFEGPVLVTATYRGEFAQSVAFTQPEVTTQGQGDTPALASSNQATVVFVGRQNNATEASSTWLVMAGADVQTYTVNFRSLALTPFGANECRSEHEQRN